MFWTNTFVLVYLIENSAWRLGHNRLQFYFLKCWHLSKCSHGMFVWFVDWHFLFVTCLTKKEPCRPNPTVLVGSRPFLAAETFIKFLFYFPLPWQHSALSFYFDMHNIIALPVILQQKTYLKRLRFPTWDLSRNSVYYSSPHLPPSCHASLLPIVTFSLILDLLTERTQGAKLMEISLYCHSSFILKTRLTFFVCDTLLPSMCIKKHNSHSCYRNFSWVPKGILFLI